MAREKLTGFPQVAPRGGLTGSTTTRNFALGSLAMDTEGNIYEYVQNNTADAIAIADGTCVYPTTTVGVVSPDISGGNGVTARVYGVGISAIAAGSYGFIQRSGIHDKVKTDAGVVAGDALIGHTVDGEADTMAAGEEHLVFGFALTADTTTEPHSCQAILTCL